MSWACDSFDLFIIVVDTIEIITREFFAKTHNFCLINWIEKLSYNFFCNIATNVFFIVFFLLWLSSLLLILVSDVALEIRNNMCFFLKFHLFGQKWNFDLVCLLQLRTEKSCKHILVWYSSYEGWKSNIVL